MNCATHLQPLQLYKFIEGPGFFKPSAQFSAWFIQSLCHNLYVSLTMGVEQVCGYQLFGYLMNLI